MMEIYLMILYGLGVSVKFISLKTLERIVCTLSLTLDQLFFPLFHLRMGSFTSSLCTSTDVNGAILDVYNHWARGAPLHLSADSTQATRDHRVSYLTWLIFNFLLGPFKLGLIDSSIKGFIVYVCHWDDYLWSHFLKSFIFLLLRVVWSLFFN